MGRLRVVLLGGFEARLASGASVSVPTKKAQALLAYLGVRLGQGHSRDKLAALLWGEKSDEQARGDLRHALLALRRSLAGAEPAPLRVEGQCLALDADAVDVDVATFEQLVGEGTVPALEQAAELYRGDLLLGFSVSEPLFEEWLVAERERLREMALEALARLLAEQAKTAATERAIQTAVRLLGLDPLQEAVHRTLMRLYSRQGRRGAALKQYQLCVRVLRRELGTEPERETRALYQELVRGKAAEPSTVRPGRRDRPATLDFPEAETPMFGRQAELERLRQMLEEAIGGRGQIATVVGEAGIGKTRLASALAADAVARGCRVLIGRSHESDTILPFGPWVDAFRAGELSADEAILGALHPARRAELTRLLPEAGQAGLPPASDSALPLFESVTAFIENVAAPQPLLLVLEDLHWADEMTLRLLAFVSRRIAGWTALLVATAREEELADAALARRTIAELSHAHSAVSLVLPPLSRPETAQLVRALARVGSDSPAAAQVEARIWAMSEGNPFVAVEAMRALDHPGLPAGAAAGGSPPDLPARVRDLVARRLDRLGVRGQQLAAVAAVIGRRFEFALLQAASGVDEQQAAEAVEEMVRHRVLQAVGHHLDFTHDRVRDVAYGRLLPLRRRLLHRAVAEALETAGAATGGQQIEQLAHHAVRGELWDKAVRSLRQAGDKAAARSALKDALAWFEQALAALEALPESRSTLEEAFEIHLAMRTVLTQLNEIDRTLQCLREAEALAERLDDDRRRGQVLAFMMNAHAVLVELDDAIASGGRALEIAGRLGDPRLRITTTTYLEVAHYWRGDYRHVVELATDNLAALPAAGADESFGSTAPASVYDRAFLVLGLAELGRFAEAGEHAAVAIRLAEPTQHGFTVSLAYRSAFTLYLLEGDWSQARAMMTRWIPVVQAANVMLHHPYAVAVSAWLLAQLGETAPALDQIREGERLAARDMAGRAVSMTGWSYRAHGRACLLLGRLDEARRWCERAVAFSAKQPGFMAHALHLRGDLAAQPDRFDAESAEASYRDALGLAQPRGMRPLIAHCHLGLGTLRARTGRGREAAEHLETAAAMYRDMDMAYWRARAEAEPGGPA
jgi:DNA-binding SARP family transcriptional activator